MLRQLLTRGSSAVFGNLMSFAASLIAVKIFALLLGPTGQGQISIIKQLFQSLNLISSLNCQSAITEGISSKESNIKKQAFYSSALLLTFISTSIALPALYIAGRNGLTIEFLNKPTNVLLLFFAVLFASFNVVCVGVLNGLNQIKSIIRGTVLNGTLQLLLAAPSALLLKNNNTDLFIAYLLLVQIALFTYYSTNLLKMGLFPRLNKAINFNELWNILRPTVALFISGASAALTLLGIRLLISNTAGYHAAGLFDAAWTIANTNATLVLTSLSIIYFPGLLKSENTHEKLTHYKLIFRLSLMIFGPLLVIISTGRGIATYILFSDEFSRSADILKFILIGDLFKSLVYTCGYLCLSLRKYTNYALIDLSWSIVFFSASFLVIDSGKYEYIGIAYATSYALAFCVYATLASHWIAWRPSGKELIVLAGFLSLLCVSAAISPRSLSEAAAFATPVTGIAVGLSLCLMTKNEREGLLRFMRSLRRRAENL